MVASYRVEGSSFRPEKLQPWSEERLAPRANSSNYALHPDGLRVAAFQVLDSQDEVKLNKAALIFNFFEELRRLAPSKQ